MKVRFEIGKTNWNKYRVYKIVKFMKGFTQTVCVSPELTKKGATKLMKKMRNEYKNE